MHSRSNVRAEAGISPWAWSAGGHLVAAAIIAFILLVPARRREEVRIDVIEAPRASSAARLQPITPAPAPPRPVPTRRGVFGASRKSITSEAGESVKAGNTVAKEVDQAKLTDNDADSLPIPADEFMVSEMPRLESEVRIPYPPEAREKRVQGAVVMDLLIDAEGRVREARLVSGPGSGLDEAALEAVKGFRFRPARIQEQSVAVRIRYAYRFVLER